MGRAHGIRRAAAIVAAAVVALAPSVVGTSTAAAAITPALNGPLHTTGTDSVI